MSTLDVYVVEIEASPIIVEVHQLGSPGLPGAGSDVSTTMTYNPDGTLAFTFDYDGNVQGGRTPGTDAAVTVVAGRPGYAKPVVATGTLSRSKGISISLVAEQDRAYVNP